MCGDDTKPSSATLESLPTCLVLCVLDFLPALDYYNLKLAGSRYITDVVRAATSRIPRRKHLQAIQDEDTKRRGALPNVRRPALQIMIERGQSTLVLYYKQKYSKHTGAPRYRKESCSFMPALHWAAYYGSIEILRMLLDRVNHRSSRGWTPLHFAAKNGQMEAAKILLENGAEINAMDGRGKTALDFAVLYQHSLMSKFLRSKGAAPDAKTILQDIENNWSRVLPLNDQCMSFSETREEKYTFKREPGIPIMKVLVDYLGDRAIMSGERLKSSRKSVAVGAVANNYYHLLRFVLNDGFDINEHVDSQERTLVHIAAKESKIDIIQLLIDHGADLTTVSKSKRTALHSAVTRNHEDAVRLLLDSGIPVNIAAGTNLTALHDATSSGNIPMINYLLQRGADIEAKSPDTPLQLAVLEQGEACVAALLDAGANPNVRDKDGDTPLIIACKKSARSVDLDLIKLLLEHGADANAHNNGVTALHYYPNKLLIEHGADINLQIDNVDSPFHKALKRGEIAAPIAAYTAGDIHSRDANGRSPLHLAARHCRLDTMESILSRGASVTAKDEEGNTPLHYAFSNFSVIASAAHKIELLLSHGADINALNDKGFTPLILAAKSRGVSCMIHMMKYNPDINVADREGRTALHFIAKYRGVNFDKDFEALLKAGIDVNKKDDKGLTPLFYALDTPDASMVRLLLKYGADPDACDSKKRTPLHHAALYLLSLRCVDTTRMLLDHGADPNLKDENGRVASEISIHIGTKQLEAIIQEHAQRKSNPTNCASIE